MSFKGQTLPINRLIYGVRLAGASGKFTVVPVIIISFQSSFQSNPTERIIR